MGLMTEVLFCDFLAVIRILDSSVPQTLDKLHLNESMKLQLVFNGQFNR